MRYAIMFMLDDYPTYFNLYLPEGVGIHPRIHAMATLILKVPALIEVEKDRGDFLKWSDRKDSSTEEILAWLDDVLADKPKPAEITKIVSELNRYESYTLVSSEEACRENSVHTCAVCGSGVELFAYATSPDEPRKYAVMCTHSEKFGPQDHLIGPGCVLYMPPNEFYCPTEREAIGYWNAWSAAVEDLRSVRTIETMPDGLVDRVEEYMQIHSPLTLRKLKESIEKLREVGGGEYPEPEQYFSAIVGMAMLKAYVAGLSGNNPEKPFNVSLTLQENGAIIKTEEDAN